MDLSEHLKKLLEKVIEEYDLENYAINITKGSESGDNYLGEISRIQIDGIKKGKQESLKLIAKSASTNLEFRNHLKANDLYVRECFTYTKLHPNLKELQDKYDLTEEEKYFYAKMYKCCDEELKETLIFEDLSEKHFAMYDRHLSFDYDHTMLCFKTLAQFHAATIVLKEQRPEIYKETLKVSCDMNVYRDLFKSYLDKIRPAVLKACENVYYKERLMEFYENMHLDFIECLNPKNTDPYNVICHGDFWTTNMMFRYENSKPVQMILLDYQLLREATPVSDISFMIFFGLNRENRRNYYKAILKLYYDTLSHNVTKMGANINKYYPEAVYWDHVNKYMKIGWIWNVMLLPFILGEKGKATDINAMARNTGGLKTAPISKTGERHLRELVEDCLEYEII